MNTWIAELSAQQNQASPEGPNRMTAHHTGKNLRHIFTAPSWGARGSRKTSRMQSSLYDQQNQKATEGQAHVVA